MSWLLAAYAAVTLSVGFYYLRLVRLRRDLRAELNAEKAGDKHHLS
jgi:hypothetical protein